LARDSRAEYHGVWQPASNCCHDRIHERHYFFLAAQVSRTCCPLRHDLSTFKVAGDNTKKCVDQHATPHYHEEHYPINLLGSTGMVSFCLVRVPWAHRSGRPIDIVDYQESQQTAVFAPTDSVAKDNPCRRFHRTSATSRHSHILCEVGGRLEPDQPE